MYTRGVQTNLGVEQVVELTNQADVEIVVPVFNEIGSISEFYDRVERLGHAAGLILVDNGSTDGTLELLDRLPLPKVIRHGRNLGYGASIRDGLAASRAARVIIIDADLEYPPEEIPNLIEALDRSAVVYASRFLMPASVGMPVLRRFGNWVVSRVFNALFGQKTTDFYTGMKGLRREAIRSLDLCQGGFEHVVEMGAQLARAGFQIAEIPVRYTPRTFGISKMRHFPEMLKYAWYVVRYRMNSGASRPGER